MEFKQFYFKEEESQPSVIDVESWKDRKVWHITPTGRRSKIRIRYLPWEQQRAYEPWAVKQLRLKREKEAEENGQDVDDLQIKLTNKSKKKRLTPIKRKLKRLEPIEDISDTQEEVDPYLMEFYYAVDVPENFNAFAEDEQVEAFIDAVEMQEFELEGKYIAEMMYVPMKAVIAFKNEDDEWQDYDKNMSDEDKYDDIKFGENKWFKIAVYDYLDDIRFELLTDIEGDEESEIKKRNEE